MDMDGWKESLSAVYNIMLYMDHVIVAPDHIHIAVPMVSSVHYDTDSDLQSITDSIVTVILSSSYMPSTAVSSGQT